MNIYFSSNEDDTKKIANQIFNEHKSKTNVFLISGKVGIGKTFFINSILQTNINRKFTSPTYNVRKQFDNFVHYDLYLLHEKKLSKELELQLNDDAQSNFVFVEWPSFLKKTPKNSLTIKLKKMKEKIKIKVK